MTQKTPVADEKTAKKLIDLIKDKNIAQISVTEGTSHITVKQKVGKPQVLVPIQNPAAVINPDTNAKDTNTINTEVIKSETIGTFHTSQKGTAIIEVGTTVEAGAKMAIIKSMKIENDVKAPYKCKVLAILPQENGIVDWGAPLFKVEKL